MIKAGVGCSQNSDSLQAAKEAALQAMERGGIAEADWAIVFCTFPHRSNYRQILKSVCEITRTKNVAGCSAIGVLTNLGEIEAESAISVLVVSSNTLRADSFLFSHSGDGGIHAGAQIGEHLRVTDDENSLLAILSDPFHIHPELLFRGIESRLGEIPIVGASASEHPAMGEAYEFHGDTVKAGAVSGLFLHGDFRYTIGITQGCQPVGVPSIITKADRNIIFELDGEPAFEVLKKQVPKRLTEDPEDLMHLVFAGFTPDPNETEIAGRDYLVRNLIGVNADTGIVGIAENVKEGQIMTFTLRHPTMAREDLKQMLDLIKSKSNPNKPYKFGMYFNCCARGSSLYGYQGIDTAYITNALGDIPIIGFFGNSEFAPIRGMNYLFTYTGVLVLISD